MLVPVNSDVSIVHLSNLRDAISQHQIMGTVPNLLMVSTHLCLLKSIKSLIGFKRSSQSRAVDSRYDKVIGIVLDGWTMLTIEMRELL